MGSALREAEARPSYENAKYLLQNNSLWALEGNSCQRFALLSEWWGLLGFAATLKINFIDQYFLLFRIIQIKEK